MKRRIGLDFAKEHGVELQAFLYEAALHGYGSEGNVNDTESDDGGTKIVYERGDWRYSDKYFGGEPFSGLTVIRYKGIACFTMTYWGKVMGMRAYKEKVYDCLQSALMCVRPEHPWRGLNGFVSEHGLCYANIWHGDINEFSGQEKVADLNDNCLYKASYHGGIVNTF
ncbi:MAG: DUF5680 domain-containing protein [Candidatus Nomurabacteria bacterium]|jgi:hypothetical protein|nr:DUF5680 domain-containing protein [Candidatus Nomurabacteria bacterium]